MAKKRDRRVATQRKERVESSTQEHELGDSASSDRRLIFIFVFFFIVSPAISVLIYRFKFAPTTTRMDSYVYDGGLVKPDVNYREILTENGKVSENMSRRYYNYPVLAYITPWNSRGYELAKRFNSKFTHLSPVWYDLKSQGSKLVLEGRHNADIGWISDLRMAGKARVLPRVVLEVFPNELLTKKKLSNRAINLIVSECKEMGYDGIVLESWSRWAAYGILHDPSMRSSALQFIKQLGSALHSVSSEGDDKHPLELVYVIGPPRSEKLQEYDFGPEDLRSLGDAVDGFSLMTYDFSGPQNPGPNAPLKWISSTLQLLRGSTGSGAWSLVHKIFLGINFYGNDYILSGDRGGGAITGNDYLSLLEKHRPAFQWEKNSGEHFFFYSDNNHNRHAVFYPSLMSISLRLEEARKWGCGISIWEIGQGTDFDANGVLDTTISFATENPGILAGGLVVLAVPLVLSQILKKAKPWGVESARNAYAKLGDDANAQLVDIRPPVEFRQVGGPNIGGLGKKPVSIVYKGEDKPGFLKKLSLKFKEPENTTLFILDKFDGSSELVAELVTVNGFKAAYAIKDGAEGPRGWMNSNLPWIEPGKALSFDLGNLTDAIGDAIGEGSGGLSVTLGLAAATGLGLLAFTEIETILQLLGSAALVQFVSTKLLFAEDRKETVKQAEVFLNTKIAPLELVDDVKQIGNALLPSPVNGKALPAPAEATSADNSVQNPETIPEPKAEATAEPAQEINSVPKPEVKAESLPGFSRPLSPYPAYPDFKPPTSPTPSQP